MAESSDDLLARLKRAASTIGPANHLCALLREKARMPESEAAIRWALAETSLSPGQVTKLLKTEGISMGDKSVRTHREGTCSQCQV